MRINWRERFLAATIHFLITLAVAALAAAVIFLVWFPGALAKMVGGTKLFLLIVSVDVALGPLISLVIYSSRKSRKKLVMDYSVVAVVQLAALLYGVFTIAVSRPVFIAFAADRLEVVTAIELEDADLSIGTGPAFRSRSWSGPRLVSVELPTDAKERSDLLDSALAGKDAYLMPKYYRPYDAADGQIDRRSRPLASLLEQNAAEKDRIERAVAATRVPGSELRWLLVHHRFGFAVALIDSRTRQPVKYILMDPAS